MAIVGDICLGSVIVNLPSEPIVFILTSKIDTLKSLKHDLNAFCRFGKHRLNWNPHFNLAMILKFFMLVTEFH